MEEILDQLITVGAGLGILSGAWFIWLLSGIANNLFSDQKWSWKRMFEDIIKTLVMGVAILSWVILMNILDWYTGKLGMDVSAILDGATVVGLLAVIVGGSANYAFKAYKNFANFIGTNHVAKVVGGQDYSGIATDVKDTFTAIANSINTQHEGSGAIAGGVLSKTETKRLAEMGATPYYKVDVSTPQAAFNNLIGKGLNEGWGLQCVAGFKEFMYSLCGRYASAGGAASGYAYEPARSAVCKLGFTWHGGVAGLQDGDWGIWTNGLYGHVAMYYQGKWLGQNQGAADGGAGNAFNLMVLPMQGFAGYFRPNIYTKLPGQKSDTAAPADDEKNEITPGDKVKVVKYIDVNGTKLANIQSTPYSVYQVRKTDRTTVLKSDDGDIYARMSWDNIKKV